MLQSRYNLDPLVLEPGGGESLVEEAGYIPADVRIRELIMAGERLGEYRREAYDFSADDDVDFSAVDPTRSAGFDMAEASQLAAEADRRLRKQQADADEKRKSAAAAMESSKALQEKGVQEGGKA